MGLKGKLIAGFAAVTALGIGGFALVSDYTYSDGIRQGTVTKLSRKGILCKTWEGEAAMSNFSKDNTIGSTNRGTDNTFYFSVPNAELATQIRDAMQQNQLVNLDYEQKLFPLDYPVPGLCQRRTEYEVTGVRVLPNQPAVAPQLAPAPGVRN